MDYLPVQVTSVPCECIFLSAKDTDTAKWNQINPSLMEALQMLKFSLKNECLNFMDRWKTIEANMHWCMEHVGIHVIVLDCGPSNQRSGVDQSMAHRGQVSNHKYQTQNPTLAVRLSNRADQSEHSRWRPQPTNQPKPLRHPRRLWQHTKQDPCLSYQVFKFGNIVVNLVLDHFKLVQFWFGLFDSPSMGEGAFKGLL